MSAQIDDVLAYVCAAYHVHPDVLRSRLKRGNLPAARAVFCYLCSKSTTATASAIAKAVGVSENYVWQLADKAEPIAEGDPVSRDAIGQWREAGRMLGQQGDSHV